MVAVVWTTLLLIATWIYAHRMATIASEPFFYSDLGSYLAGRSNTLSFHRSQLINSENKFRVWLSVFLLLLMEVQVLRRLFETLYVFKYSPSARMHIFGYLTGILWVSWSPRIQFFCCSLSAHDMHTQCQIAVGNFFFLEYFILDSCWLICFLPYCQTALWTNQITP